MASKFFTIVLKEGMKKAMKQAGVKKPTFPGPRATELLNKKIQKLKDKGANRKDVMESHADIDARISRKFLRGFNPKGKK